MAECGASNEHIDNGAPCIYLAGHLDADIPHTTRNGLWWRDDPAPTPEVEAGERETCGATEDGYRTCTLPLGHPGRFHQEWRDGKLWAESSGDDRPAPSRSPQGSELGDGAVEDCERCAAAHPKRGCADVGCSHNCEAAIAFQGEERAHSELSRLVGSTWTDEQEYDTDTIARAVLASDWLAQREAAAVKAALLSAADDLDRKFHLLAYDFYRDWLRDRANRSEGGRA